MALRITLLKAMLALPARVLRPLSGGRLERGGRVLDPRFGFLAAAARGLPPLHGLTPLEARRVGTRGQRQLGGPREPGVTTQALTVPAPLGAVPARLYRPERPDPTLPAVVFSHFGGGVLGDLETADAFCSVLSAVARVPVLSVDYRLAPEHPWPAGLEDAIAAARWAREQAEGWGAAPGRVAVAGDSIGGNFAAVTCQTLRAAGEPQPALQLLVYPAVDMASETQSMATYADSWPLSADTMRWFRGHYLPADADPADPRLSPLCEPDLSGLAPAVVVTAGFDPLVDQGEAYARRLMTAGVPVIYRCYDHLPHGFTGFAGAIPSARTACREIAGMLREGLEGRLPAAQAVAEQALAAGPGHLVEVAGGPDARGV